MANVTSRLVGIKAAKGTGKTEALAQQVQQAIAKGIPVIVLTHREQLAKELAQRFGLPYRSELEFGAESFHGYVLCVDSLHPQAKPAFDPSRYPDALVILDEAEQVIWHLLNSVTCQRNRPAILETLSQLLNGAGQIVVSDADLTRISLDYLHGLLTVQCAPWVLVNEYHPASARKAFLYDAPEALFSDALECIQNGERLIIHTGAQKVSSKWGTINLETTLSGAFPELNILRIDAESVAEPGHPAYGVMGNLNAIIPLYDIVIASPTLETGVSIDVKGHFHRVFCFAPGSQTAEAVCQSLARVREDLPRHLWIKKYSNQSIGNGSTIPKILVSSQQKLFKANSLLLGQADTIANLDGHCSRHMVTWARYSALHNHGFKKYRDVILSRLEAEGYSILSTDAPDDAKSVGEFMKAYTEANYQQHCEKVAAAPCSMI
ncbi:AAA family ATPase (plasmid) [Synechocystis sp. B12]|nr:AAA family ATPase [Synechocystis sp. B12]